VVYSGRKEYDSQYVWGQLVGWFKQTVGKPNASLSADRRGTLSIPDLNSFIVKSSNGLSSDTLKKRSLSRRLEEEVISNQGSSTRPRTHAFDTDKLESLSEVGRATQLTEMGEGFDSGSSKNIIYPHKKYTSRKEFLEKWHENFAKPWDVCCKWQFKNLHHLYGSVQFESLLKAD
jgi:hypothetical protein